MEESERKNVKTASMKEKRGNSFLSKFFKSASDQEEEVVEESANDFDGSINCLL